MQLRPLEDTLIQKFKINRLFWVSFQWSVLCLLYDICIMDSASCKSKVSSSWMNEEISNWIWKILYATEKQFCSLLSKGRKQPSKWVLNIYNPGAFSISWTYNWLYFFDKRLAVGVLESQVTFGWATLLGAASSLVLSTFWGNYSVGFQSVVSL